MGAALAESARDEGIHPERRAMLALDRAGGHANPALAIPEGVHLAFLPPASPELQPAERPWGLVDEPVASRTRTGRWPTWRRSLSRAAGTWRPTAAPSRLAPTSTGGPASAAAGAHSDHPDSVSKPQRRGA